MLKSGKNSKVFFYYTDHGFNGGVALPGNKTWYSSDFIKTIKSMSSKNMFSEMVIYIEACNSGSMFK